MHFSILKNNKKHSYLKEFRAWLYLEKTTFSIEWQWMPSPYHCTIGINLATDEDLFQIKIAPILFWFSFSIENFKAQQWLAKKIKRKDEKYGNGRQIGISFFAGAMWLNLWHDPDESRSSDPSWWSIVIHFDNLIFGKSECNKILLEERDILIPMPEKAYQGHIKIMEYTWKRPRWFKKTIKRAEIDIPEGIPHEGKGENSWDCGTDATYGMTTGKVLDIPDAIGQLITSCLRNRVRYGGWGDWNWSR